MKYESGIIIFLSSVGTAAVCFFNETERENLEKMIKEDGERIIDVLPCSDFSGYTMEVHDEILKAYS